MKQNQPHTDAPHDVLADGDSSGGEPAEVECPDWETFQNGWLDEFPFQVGVCPHCGFQTIGDRNNVPHVAGTEFRSHPARAFHISCPLCRWACDVFEKLPKTSDVLHAKFLQGTFYKIVNHLGERLSDFDWRTREEATPFAAELGGFVKAWSVQDADWDGEEFPGLLSASAVHEEKK